MLRSERDQSTQRDVEAPGEVVAGDEQVPQPRARRGVVQPGKGAGQGVVPDGERPDLAEPQERCHGAGERRAVEEDPPPLPLLLFHMQIGSSRLT